MVSDLNGVRHRFQGSQVQTPRELDSDSDGIECRFRGSEIQITREFDLDSEGVGFSFQGRFGLIFISRE